MPEGDIFKGGHGISANDAGEAAQAFAGDGIALVRHGAAAFLSLAEILLHLEHLGALQVAEFRRPAIDAGSDECEIGHELRMAVALQDLGGKRGGLEIQALANDPLDLGIKVGVGSHGSADFSDSDALAHFAQALEAAGELIIHEGHLEAEADRFRMDAVAAADHGSELEFVGTDCHGFAQGEKVFFQNVAGLQHLHRECGVEQVGGGQTLVNPAGRRTHAGGDIFDKGDDIVVRAFFDFADGVDVEGALGADRGGVLLGDRAEFGHGLAGEGFNFEPDFEFALFGPDGPHAGQ